MPSFGERLSNMLLGGMQGWETGERLRLMNEGQDDRREQREQDRVLRAAALADRGVYKGESPTDTQDLEIPVPGLPVPLKIRLDNSKRYKDLGGGFYQDFAQSPAGRQIAAQQGRDDLARQNRFETDFAARQKQAGELSRQNTIRDAIRNSGLFTPGEMDLVAAAPEIGDDVARSAINARTQRRFNGPTGRTANDPEERAIKHEDDRRKSIVAGNEAKIRRANAQEDPLTGEVIDPERIADLEATTDSIRGRIGTAPDAPPARDTRTIPTADQERKLADEANDAIRRGADPAKVNARLQQLLRQVRGQQ